MAQLNNIVYQIFRPDYPDIKIPIKTLGNSLIRNEGKLYVTQPADDLNARQINGPVNKYFVYQYNNHLRLKTSEGLIEINRSSTSRSVSQLSWLTPPNTTELTAISLLLLFRFRHFRITDQRLRAIRIRRILLDRLDQLRCAVPAGRVGLRRVEHRGTTFRCRICVLHGCLRAVAPLRRSDTGVHLLLDLRDAATAGRSGSNHIDLRGIQRAAVFRIPLQSVR